VNETAKLRSPPFVASSSWSVPQAGELLVRCPYPERSFGSSPKMLPRRCAPHSCSGPVRSSTDLSNTPKQAETVRIVSMSEFYVGELVRQRMGALSAAERRLGQVLLAFYPVAGLESLTASRSARE